MFNRPSQIRGGGNDTVKNSFSDIKCISRYWILSAEFIFDVGIYEGGGKSTETNDQQPLSIYVYKTAIKINSK